MSDVALFDELRSIDFGSISGTYTEITPSFEHVVRIINFDNNTDGDMFISLDGVTNHLFMPANSLKVFDLTTNRSDYNSSWAFAKGTRIFIKQSSAPTSGSFYIACIFQRGQ
jgi:hypothetical protein